MAPVPNQGSAGRVIGLQVEKAVEAGGFKKATRGGIELNANAKYTVDFQLEIGNVEQEVTVVASELQVELQSAQISGLISGTQVRELAPQ